MKFVGVNGAQDFGYYVGPYAGTMDGTSVDLFCVDFMNEVSFGQQWDANLTAITPGSDLGDTRYGTLPGAVELYQEAAWLTLQFALQPTSEYGDIQSTIWRLFSPTAPAPSSSWWLGEAQKSYATADYSDFRIVTNVGPVLKSGQVQEFLTHTPNTGAPEPGTQLMVGAVLASAACISRRLRMGRSVRRNGISASRSSSAGV
jgi:hypothetical protein